MINCNQQIFSRLIDCARRSERTVDHLNDVRWIETNDEEKAWLCDLSLVAIRSLSPRVRTACFSFGHRNFFVAVGFDERTAPESILEPIELNAGIVTALLAELDVPIREAIDPLVVINEVLAQFRGREGYSGHPFVSIAALFEPLAVYEIKPDSPISPVDLARLSCFWILQNGERMVLPFSTETRNQMEELTATGATSIPFGVLLNCFQSSQWPHAFLEAYRCVERLFSFQIIEDLHRDLAITVSLLKFAEKIENAIGWRPREEDAIERLFGLLPPNALTLMEDVRDNVSANRAEKVAGWVYSLRNSVVHFRPAIMQFSLTDAQWDDMVRATILLIGKIYGAYDAQLQAA